MRIEFTAPVRIESEMNRREHWTKRRERFATQKQYVLFAWPRAGECRDVLIPPRRACLKCVKRALPLTVTLTRIGSRKLDSDNLAGGFKAVRDEVARILGLDDGDSRIEWRYAQRKGKPKEYAAHILIETKDTP